MSRSAKATPSRWGSAKALVIETPGHTKRPCQLLLPEGRGRVCRRHAVLGRLRQAARRRRQDHVAFAAKADGAAARDAALLRARIYPRQCQIRAHRRARQRGASGARGGSQRARRARASRPCQRPSRKSLPPTPSSVHRAPRSSSGSAWRGGTFGRFSARRGSARTGSDRGGSPHRGRGDCRFEA